MGRGGANNKGGKLMQISRPRFLFVESELYNYDYTKKEIEAMRDDILEKISSVATDKDYVTGGEISNPTEQKGIKLLSCVALMHMERTIAAIDRALLMLSEEHNQIFEMKYRKNYDWVRITMEMPTSRETYFRKRREIVQTVAAQLGLISL
jgi:RinA family phage transcriptional activator